MEREFAIHPALQKKSVLVIGGGPGGMEAARVAALRGHKVKLWEKSGQLGGNLVPGSVPEFKSDVKALMEYLSCQIKKLGVQIELNKEATPELVKNANPDEVIIATGGMPILPEISGYGKMQSATATDLLLGKKEAGKKVVVVGGDVVGCETALWLAQKGKKVTIIETLEDVMVDILPANKQHMLQMLTKAGVSIVTGVKILEITDKGIRIENSGGKEVLEADTIAVAMGLKPEANLVDKLKDAHFPVHAIGDCVQPRKIQNAIWEGFRLALRI